jgi:CheY-like chemotaxis protein
MRLVRKEKPDLILLDIMMPEKGGVEMYRELKSGETTKDIPIVIVTGVTRGRGFDDKIVTGSGDIAAPDGYIEKPMNPDAVVKVINDLLS